MFFSWGCPGSWTKEWLWGHVEGRAAFLSRCWGGWISVLEVGILKKTVFLSLKEVEQRSQHVHVHMLCNSFLSLSINLNLFISIYSLSSTVLNVRAVWAWVIMSNILWGRPLPFYRKEMLNVYSWSQLESTEQNLKLVGFGSENLFHSAPLWGLGFLQVKQEGAAFTRTRNYIYTT